MLFDADHEDRVIDEAMLHNGAIDCTALSDRQLLWIDVEQDQRQDEVALQRLVERLDLGDGATCHVRRTSGE